MLDTDFYLFVYDIHSPKVINKVARRLECENSMRIQKSVFEVQGEKRDIERLIEDVKKLIDDTTDKIAVIPLCSSDYDNVYFYGVLSRRPNKLPSYFIL